MGERQKKSRMNENWTIRIIATRFGFASGFPWNYAKTWSCWKKGNRTARKGNRLPQRFVDWPFESSFKTSSAEEVRRITTRKTWAVWMLYLFNLFFNHRNKNLQWLKRINLTGACRSCLSYGERQQISLMCFEHSATKLASKTNRNQVKCCGETVLYRMCLSKPECLVALCCALLHSQLGLENGTSTRER